MNKLENKKHTELLNVKSQFFKENKEEYISGENKHTEK